MTQKQTKNRATVTQELEPTGVDILSQMCHQAADQQQLNRVSYKAQLVAQTLCCGVWQRVANIEVELAIDDRGRLFMMNPITLPDGAEGWGRLSIACKRYD